MANTKCSTTLTDKTKIISRPVKRALAPERICNLDYLTAITRGNREKINNLLGVFLEEIPKELTALTAAIEKTNYTVICDILHKIKCSFSILGIATLTSPVDEMKDLSNIALGIKRIQQLNQRVNLIFRQAMEELRIESGHTVSPIKIHL
ncbi:MAG TPA: Hpt domain-containing protein [Ferruginibacter sp.]|nr:Hpt domain-containing protein [Ferruginibacter sp.]